MTTKKMVHGGDAFRYGDVLEFSSNVNPFGPSRKAVAALRGCLTDIRHYPDPDASRLREAIAHYVGVDPLCITPGNGSTEVIKNLCEVFIRSGDVALLPSPTFSEYGRWLDHYGAEVKRIPLDDFVLPADTIIKEMEKGVRALFLCNPNNPTGKLVPVKEMERILGVAETTGTLVIVDEAYIEFTRGQSLCQKAATSRNLFVLRSLTKFFSLAGLRVGFGVAGIQMISQVEGSRIPWNVNRMAIEAACASLEDKGFMEGSRERIERERSYLSRGLGRLFNVVPSDSNFFLISLSDKGITAPVLKARLLEMGILVRDCSSFDGLDENWFRVSIRDRKDNRRLLASLKGVLEDVH